ncbi:hypothetical protein [Nostoc sp. DedSLP04]|nr:hypothetical protein [Nostoc sp. DedSLP04]MDZ8034981.1 hypothetical protein [Nostoc sp. DedSLP04]
MPTPQYWIIYFLEFPYWLWKINPQGFQQVCRQLPQKVQQICPAGK